MDLTQPNLRGNFYEIQVKYENNEIKMYFIDNSNKIITPKLQRA